MDKIAFRNTLEETSSRIMFNESLIQITEYLREDERLNMTDDVDVDNMMDVQYDIREQIMMYEEDMTFTQDNFKMTHSTSCMPEIFILMLMSITDTSEMTTYDELFDLYKSHNWSKQNIEIALTIDDEEFYENKIDPYTMMDDIKYPERNILKCACGHNCKDRNTIMIKNGKTSKQILVGSVCIQKTFDEQDCKMINKKLKQSLNSIQYNNHLEKMKIDIEMERLKQEHIDATFRRCVKCNRQNIIRTKPDWVKMCVGCYVDDKDKDIKGKCLIKIK
jgi:hypothetical protein